MLQHVKHGKKIEEIINNIQGRTSKSLADPEFIVPWLTLYSKEELNSLGIPIE